MCSAIEKDQGRRTKTPVMKEFAEILSVPIRMGI